MPKEYQLKKDPMDENRLKKTAKQIIDDCKEDRRKAADTFDYFKKIVDNAGDDVDVSEDKSLMVDCLKLMQTSKTSMIKLVDILLKLERPVADSEGPMTFEKLMGEEDD